MLALELFVVIEAISMLALDRFLSDATVACHRAAEN